MTHTMILNHYIQRYQHAFQREIIGFELWLSENNSYLFLKYLQITLYIYNTKMKLTDYLNYFKKYYRYVLLKNFQRIIYYVFRTFRYIQHKIFQIPVFR